MENFYLEILCLGPLSKMSSLNMSKMAWDWWFFQKNHAIWKNNFVKNLNNVCMCCHVYNIVKKMQ